MSDLKVAIVGCGKIADGHVEQVQKLSSLARMVAVCDLELLMAEQLARRYDVPAYYDDFAKLLEREKPDVVHITTPPSSHLALTKMSLEAGAHVYVEKPITPTCADTEALVKLCEDAKKKLTVGWTYLFDPPALVMRDLIAAGEIGEPVHVESNYGYNLSGPYGSAIMGDANNWVHRLPGGLYQNNVDHLLNKLVEFYPDDDDPRVFAFGDRQRPQRYGDARDDMVDELRLMIAGKRVTASGMFSSHARPMAHLCRVHGTKNTVTVDYNSRTVTLEATTELPSAIGRLVPAFDRAAQFAREGLRNVERFAKSDFHFFAGLYNLVERFYLSIRDDSPPPISHRDIRWVTRRLQDIIDQVESGRAAAVSAVPMEVTA